MLTLATQFVFVASTLVLGGQHPSAMGSDCSEAIKVSEVTAPTDEAQQSFSLSDHYTKLVSVGELPVVSSEKVADAALLEAAWLIRQMLSHRPEILSALARNNVRFSVMAVDEFTTDVPEHSDLKPKEYWDRRARGLGATTQRPSVSCGEENLLCYPGDPYSTENILIHEFGHAIHEMGLKTVDPTFDERLKITYQQAMESGLWQEKYASSNRSEYWAEGVQSWFDTNREDDHDHNHVNTRDEIREYDPGLSRLLEEVFGDGKWRYTRPETRDTLPHLKTWNRESSPQFQWPKKVVKRFDEFTQVAEGKPIPADQEIWTEAEHVSSNSSLQSGDGKQPTFMLFVNRRSAPVRIFWVDQAGERRDMGRIRPDGHRLIDTYRTHAWLVTDAEGNALLRTISTRDNERVLIAEQSSNGG